MGPQATSLFFERIVANTKAGHDCDHIETVILNCCKIQEKSGGIYPEYDLLKKEIENLCYLGVDIIAMPCNTAHIHYDKIKTNNVINMIDETAKYISNLNPNKNIKVAVLATDTTIKTELYQNALKKQGYTAILPAKEFQQKVMHIIYEQVKKTGKGNIKDLLCIVNEMTKCGADLVILGCTELSYFYDNYELPRTCIDAMEVLVKTCTIECGKEYIGKY
jgi:aspartate racemase